MKNYYEILGIDDSANQADIKKAYRNMSKKYHPDINKDPGAEDMFKSIAEAYSILSNESKKKEYDRKLKGTSKSSFEKTFGGGFRGSAFEDWINDFGTGRSRGNKQNTNSNRFKSGFDNADTEFLNIYKEIDVDISDLINDNPIEIRYSQYDASESDDSTQIDKIVEININLKQKYFDVFEKDGDYFIKLKLNKLGNKSTISRFNEFTRVFEKSTAVIGDLHLTIKISSKIPIKIKNGDIVQEIDIPLYKTLIKGEKVRIKTALNKEYDAEISSPKYLNKLKFNISKNGIMKKDKNVGNYIIKFNIISPDLSSLTKSELNSLKDILTKNLEE